MARSNKKVRRIDWRVVVFSILTLMIALSMVLAFLPPPK